jgi:predicted subunit of tRNA(5-methylaminomethyl-2-thiouridylate) methyltransferase
MNSSPITDEMIEAGVAEAHNQAHRTYSDMCRAIYLAMRSSAPSVMPQNLVERIIVAVASAMSAVSGPTRRDGPVLVLDETKARRSVEAILSNTQVTRGDTPNV